MHFRRRAYGYVTRIKNGARQVLVFRQNDEEAGIQFPGGGIEPHETPAEGMKREMIEETGLKDFIIERELAADQWDHPQEDLHIERHFFWLSVANAPDTWDHLVTGKGEDNGMAYHYFWVNSPTEVPFTWGEADYLHLVFDT